MVQVVQCNAGDILIPRVHGRYKIYGYMEHVQCLCAMYKHTAYSK